MNAKRAPQQPETRLAALVYLSRILDDLWKNLDLLDRLRAMQRHAVNDFPAEAEELRKLRSGELKIEPSPNSKGARP